MTHRPSPSTDDADRGTQLGSATRVLARAFTAVLLPFVAGGHAVRRLGHALATVARPFGARAAAVALRLGRLVRAAVRPCAVVAHRIDRYVAWFQRRLGRVSERLPASRLRKLFVWAGVGLLAVVGFPTLAPTVAVMTVGLPLVMTIVPAVLAVVGGAVYLVVVGARWIVLPIGLVLAVVEVVLGFVERALLAVITPLLRTLARWAVAVGRVARQADALLFAYVIGPLAYAVGRTVAAVVVPPARFVARAFAIASGWITALIARWARRVSRTLVHRNRRVAHSVGVAYLRARHRATDAPATDASSVAAAHRSTAAPHDLLFEVVLYQNEYLPSGATEVHAVIEVVARGTHRADRDSPESAEVILLDCSGSMGQPWSKLRAARHATGVAIDALRDGTWFAIVRGSEHAEPVYPAGGGLAQATSTTRAAAKAALRSLWPEGGTAMGQWLLLARELFASRPSAIPHAMLLTDGKNESESPASLEAALGTCSGQFQCDCRGIGTDWNVGEFRAISARLLGTVDIVRDPTELADDFRAMAEAAMAKEVAGATLRVWTPQGAKVRYIKQVAPAISDLTPMRTPVDARTGDYPTGAWGDESRQYHVCIEVPARAVGEEMLASRVSVVVGSRAAPTALVKASWTDDHQLSTHIHRRVAHFTGQAHLARAIDDGLAARRRGDDRGAAERFGCAVLLATENGNEATLQLLRQVVEVEDATTGKVRLKPVVDAADEMALDTRSVKTVPIRGLDAHVVG